MNKIKTPKDLYDIVNINNLKELVDYSTSTYKNNIAFKFKNLTDGTISSVTYEKFGKDVNSLGTKLLDLGLKNKKIAIIGNNSYEWCVSYLSVVCGTGVVVPIDKALPKTEIENLLKLSDSECILFDKKHSEIIKQIKNDNLTNLKYFICFDSDEKDMLSFYSLISSGQNLLDNGNTDFSDAKINNDEMSIMLFTSGTTSLSKAVMLSHTNICSNIMGLSSVLKYYPDDILLSFLPIHHTFECTVTFLTGIYSGSCLAICEGLRFIAQNLTDYKVSVFITVPLVLENMYKKIQMANESSNGTLSNEDVLKFLGGHLRLALVGAAPLNKDVIIGYNNFGIKTFQGYGLTETSPVLSLENDKASKPGSIGLALPNVEIEIDNPDENGLGEIKAKGPNLMLGYYKNEDATNEVIIDGWFHTGDLGYIDENGFLFITGRKKNVIVLKNGKNIFPEEIEVSLNLSPYVSESFVYGITAKDGDLKLHAKIIYNKDYILKNHGDISEDEINEIISTIVKEINKTLPLYKLVRSFSISDEALTKTTTGKIKRYEEMKKI